VAMHLEFVGKKLRLALELRIWERARLSSDTANWLRGTVKYLVLESVRSGWWMHPVKQWEVSLNERITLVTQEVMTGSKSLKCHRMHFTEWFGKSVSVNQALQTSFYQYPNFLPASDSWLHHTQCSWAIASKGPSQVPSISFDINSMIHHCFNIFIWHWLDDAIPSRQPWFDHSMMSWICLMINPVSKMSW
jgi:hypothetical protein